VQPAGQNSEKQPRGREIEHGGSLYPPTDFRTFRSFGSVVGHYELAHRRSPFLLVGDALPLRALAGVDGGNHRCPFSVLHCRERDWSLRGCAVPIDRCEEPP
jgi:hypothetical protein